MLSERRRVAYDPSMLPESVADFFAVNQNLLWFLTIVIDLSLTLLMYRIFGRMGLYGVIVLNIILCNLLAPKITMVFGYNTTMGVNIYSGIYFATDLLGERYGRREANRAVWIGFFASILVVIFGAISQLYLPTADPAKQEVANRANDALGILFTFAPRFVFGSLLAYIISQSLDVYTFHYLKEKFEGRHLWLHNNASTLTSQAVDTAVYTFVVWPAFFDYWTAFELALVKYMFKFIIAVLDTPFIYWARTWDVDGQEGDHSHRL